MCRCGLPTTNGHFEEFPTFMDGVTEVTKLDANRSHWKVQIVGKSKEWEAEVIEQTPNERIVWRSQTGAINKGSVTFQRLTNMKSRICCGSVIPPMVLWRISE